MITQKKKTSLKKRSVETKNTGGKNTEREEHDVETEDKSKIVIPQPVLAHTHTDESKMSHGQTHPKFNHPNSQKNREKVPH